MTPAAIRARAACRTADPEIFYDPHLADASKDYCRSCEVIAACLAWALEINDAHAVLGGTTPGERAAMTSPSEPSRACSTCARPMVAKGRPRPPGHVLAGGFGMCDTCAQRARNQSRRKGAA